MVFYYDQWSSKSGRNFKNLSLINFWWFRWKMNRLNVLEEIVCFTVLVQSGMKLDWSIPFLIAGTVSILNFPDLFPPEDSR